MQHPALCCISGQWYMFTKRTALFSLEQMGFLHLEKLLSQKQTLAPAREVVGDSLTVQSLNLGGGLFPFRIMQHHLNSVVFALQNKYFLRQKKRQYLDISVWFPDKKITLSGKQTHFGTEKVFVGSQGYEEIKEWLGKD